MEGRGELVVRKAKRISELTQEQRDAIEREKRIEQLLVSAEEMEGIVDEEESTPFYDGLHPQAFPETHVIIGGHSYYQIEQDEWQSIEQRVKDATADEAENFYRKQRTRKDHLYGR
jgi:hypothetical protein